MQPGKAYDFSGVPDDAIPEFYRQAELYLDNLVKIGLAADARATTSSSVFGAAAAALLAVSANIANSASPALGQVSALISAVIFLALASGLCALAARPKEFFHPGHPPDVLYDVATSETNIKRKMAEKIQGRIDANLTALQSAAEKLKWGQNLAALAPIAFLSTSFWFYPHP